MKEIIFFVLFACCLAAFEAVGQQTNTPPVNVIVWGDNTFGQTNVPADLTNAISVAGGFDFCLALRPDGTVRAWGNNNQNQCNVPTGLTNVAAIACGNWFGLALKADGSVVLWGPTDDHFHGTPAGFVGGLSNILAISACQYWVAALTATGTITSSDGINPPADLNNAVALSAGSGFYMALRSNGKIAVWGDNSHGQTNPIPSILKQSNYVAVAAGYTHCLALKSTGVVVAWGDNSSGQCNIPTLTNVIAITAGDGFSMALQSDGTIVSWGALAVPPNMPFTQTLVGGGENGIAVVNPTQAASPPIILRQPVTQTIAAGSTGVLVVGASAFGQITYQWFFGTNAITSATNASLLLPNIQVQQSGPYYAVVSNAVGSVPSQVASLSVVPSLSINFVPAVSMYGGVGLTYNVQFIDSVGPTNAPWTTLATVTLTNSPQFYFDASAIGQASRLYRIVQLP